MANFRRHGRVLALVFVLWLLTASAQDHAGPWVSSSTPTLSGLSSSSVSTSLDVPNIQQSTSSSSGIVPDGIGGYIAAGLGMTRATDMSSMSNPSMGMEIHKTTLDSGVSTTPATKSQQISSNYTLAFTGDCWEQWSSYWSATSSASSAWTRVSILATSTYTLTDWSISATTERFSGTTTVTVKNGAFAQTTLPPLLRPQMNIFHSQAPRSTQDWRLSHGIKATSRACSKSHHCATDMCLAGTCTRMSVQLGNLGITKVRVVSGRAHWMPKL